MQAVVDLTQDLIRFKTMHNQQEEIQRCMAFIEDYLNSHQLAYTRIEDGGYPSILMMPEDNTANVLLMTHIDVVDAADELFDPTIRDGNLYGRGAIDDKYAAALSLVLAKEHIQMLRKQGRTQKDLPFGVLITSDEEVGGYNGVGAVVNTITPEFCIALDGGNPERIITKEKGLLTVKLIAAGKAAHGSRPWLGDNAIDNLMADYAKLKTLFDKPKAGTWLKTMSLNILNAGKSFNQVPDRAEAVFDIRYTENEDPDELFERLQMRYSGVGDLVDTEVQLAKSGQARQMCHPGIGNRGELEIQMLQILECLQLGHGRIGDALTTQREHLQSCKPFEALQPYGGNLGADEIQ